MKIKSIESNSIAEELGIQAGDQLIQINGHKIHDEIDYRFYADEDELKLCIHRNSQEFIYSIQKTPDDKLGIQLYDFPTKGCGNHCIFCFSDQNPKNMRKTLYFKDEDFRMSFLYGHYTTLTNTKWSDLERIVNQRLSPLYISVHATDWQVRKYLFGLKRPDQLMEKIRYLADAGIQLHTQIVICPGINDGDQFKKTVSDLAQFYPGIQSIAVVPVGLTRHRQGLPELKAVTPQNAAQIIKQIAEFQHKFMKTWDTRFIFPSDEFFLRAGKSIPDSGYYEEFYQLEDGVGMLRYLLDSFSEIKKEIPTQINQPQRFTFISGTSAAPIIAEHVLPGLNKIPGLQAEILPVPNRFYGETITVTGLLTGQDIAHTVKQANIKHTVLISHKCFNSDGLLLDDWTAQKIEQKTGCTVEIVNDFLTDLPEVLKKYE